MHLDPRVDAVVVPEFLRAQPQLVLQIGLDLPVPITDLRVDDAGVFGTLVFAHNPHTCIVPWEAVFALVGDDGKGMVWPKDMPEEIAAEVESETPNPAVGGLTRLEGSLSKVERASAKPRSIKPRGVTRVPSLSEPPTVGARPSRRNSAPATAAARSSSSSASATTSNTPSPSTTAQAAQRRKPRELPPYLRVIK